MESTPSVTKNLSLASVGLGHLKSSSRWTASILLLMYSFRHEQEVGISHVVVYSRGRHKGQHPTYLSLILPGPFTYLLVLICGQAVASPTMSDGRRRTMAASGDGCDSDMGSGKS
ncbi:hypothetical protein MRB53_009386 [Persea americana]|uniref:Uncharacterized protein n=1 Tax=Persea americana TaxID=3435 RepID=A0ACC2LNV1_PERAE|nr:hypothetical protein MRB53_009386 [Persea americana]